MAHLALPIRGIKIMAEKRGIELPEKLAGLVMEKTHSSTLGDQTIITEEEKVGPPAQFASPPSQ